MTTLSALKSTIADDLLRSDLTSQIASAITTAIEYYQTDPLFLNETRDVTFPTVATQSRYTSADSANIPLWEQLSDMFLEDTAGQRYRLVRIDPTEMEAKLDSTASSSRPSEYAYFQQSFWFHPIPDAVYTVRPMGVIKKAVPASDSEANNVWMTSAYELIRCKAKWYLYGHIIQDFEMALAMGGADGDGGAVRSAYSRLKSETSRKTASGTIRATLF